MMPLRVCLPLLIPLVVLVACATGGESALPDSVPRAVPTPAVRAAGDDVLVVVDGSPVTKTRLADFFLGYRRDASWALACEGDASTDRALASLLAGAHGRWFDDLLFSLEEAYERRASVEILEALLAKCRQTDIENVPDLLATLTARGKRVPGLLALIESDDEQKIGFACAEIIEFGYPAEDHAVLTDALARVR